MSCTAPAVGIHQHPPQFLSNPFRADDDKLGRHLPDRFRRGRIELEVEHRGKADRPQQPEFVLFHPRRRIADGPDDPCRQIAFAADVVKDPTVDRIVEHAVDGKIAAEGVLGGGAVADRLRPASVEIRSLGPECGHFHRRNAFVPQDGDHAEAGPDGQRPIAAERLADLFGSRRRGDVVVLGIAAQQQIPDAPSGKQGFKTGVAQPLNNRNCQFSLSRRHTGRDNLLGVVVRGG